jgi:hypothetical protein
MASIKTFPGSVFSAVTNQLKRPMFGLSSFAILVTVFAAAKFIVHMLTAQAGFYCDELYTIDLSKHLALGYVDLPPMVPAVIALTRLLLGESLLAIHAVSALAGSVTLVFICLITRELRGKLFAVALSALGYLATIMWLIFNSFFGYDCIDQMVLSIFLFLVVRFLKTENKKLWIGIGLTAGLAFMSKGTVLSYGPGFLVALLISKHRKQLLTPWPWVAVGLFLVVIAPWAAWQYANQWPTLEYWKHYSLATLHPATVVQYFVTVAVSLAPAFPIMLMGLYRIFRRFGDKNYYFLGILFLVTLVILFRLHARFFMLMPLMMPLLAAGSILIEELLSGVGWRQWARGGVAFLLLASGIACVPTPLTILPPAQMKQYASVFGFLWRSVKMDNSPPAELPGVYGGRNGWESLVRTVAFVYHGLPQDDQSKCGIITDWFGPAGAVDMYGPKYGLPPGVCGHITYWLWGPGKTPWDVMIVVTWFKGRYQAIFEDMQQVAVIRSAYTMPYMSEIPVYLCRKPKKNMEEIWHFLKAYY